MSHIVYRCHTLVYWHLIVRNANYAGQRRGGTRYDEATIWLHDWTGKLKSPVHMCSADHVGGFMSLSALSLSYAVCLCSPLLADVLLSQNRLEGKRSMLNMMPLRLLQTGGCRPTQKIRRRSFHSTKKGSSGNRSPVLFRFID